MPSPVTPGPRPIGLLGGSFDPIHVGHLQLARDARDRLGLAEVRLIPAAQPWQKGPITDGAQRAHMVQLAIAGEPGLVLDMHEIERGGPSYTIDTLRALRAALGSAQPLVLVIGADQMARLDTWHEWQALLEVAHIAVAHRNASAPALNRALQAFHAAHCADASVLRTRPYGAIVDLPMTPVAASATEIRALLSTPPSRARDARLAALVPAPVLLYIRRQGLYAPHAQFAAREKEKPESMDLQKLQRLVVEALEDVKAQDIKVFNTIGQSDMFDRVVLASGSSNRQTRALAWSVVEKVKEAGGSVVSVEGTDPGEWVLVDLGDIVVHIMQPAIREYYGLEEMWGAKPVKVQLAGDRRSNRPERFDVVAEPAATADVLAPAPAKGTKKPTTVKKTTPVKRTRTATTRTKTPAAKKTAAKKAPTKKAATEAAAAKKAPARRAAKSVTSSAPNRSKPAAKAAKKASPGPAATRAAKTAKKAVPKKSAARPVAKQRTQAAAKKSATSAAAAGTQGKKRSTAKPAARSSARSAARPAARKAVKTSRR